MNRNNIFDELEWRGLIHTASEGAEEHLKAGPTTIYTGFDPTGPSLHIGHLLPAMGLARMQRFGHNVIALVGGGTGLIGDPSFKASERALLSKETVESYVASIGAQLTRLLDFDIKPNPARMINNADWLTTIPLTDFLRDIGKHFSVNAMLAKDSVKTRFEKEEGISFTEFSYPLLQSYDFLALHDRFGCMAQMGGSDQWGNITSGVDLIRRVRGNKAFALVYPLILNASGVKFGKSEGNAVWLDPEMTSPYKFYQYWLNADDRDAVKYLKYFTWMTESEIAECEASLAADPGARVTQRRLAKEVTELVHGLDGLAKAERASRVLFGEEISGLTLPELNDIFSDVPTTELPRSEVIGALFTDLLVKSGVATSKGDARRAIAGGGLYINNRRATDEAYIVNDNDAIEGAAVVIRKGKKKYHLIRMK